jgi:hypothetical protein
MHFKLCSAETKSINRCGHQLPLWSHPSRTLLLEDDSSTFGNETMAWDVKNEMRTALSNVLLKSRLDCGDLSGMTEARP